MLKLGCYHEGDWSRVMYNDCDNETGARIDEEAHLRDTLRIYFYLHWDVFCF